MARLPGPAARRYGTVFDAVAVEYDRHRPAYPDQLVDQACRAAGIGPGDRVLEVGCGTGQLTRSLLARGLQVTAVEPGANLLALARKNLAGAGAVEFTGVRFEDAVLPRGHFRAVFSASAFHWIDPAVSWRKAADVLVPGGTLALLSYFGLEEPRSKPDQDAALGAIAKVAPDVAATWPVYRDIDVTLTGVERRRGNVSQVWAWLGSYDLARDEAGLAAAQRETPAADLGAGALIALGMAVKITPVVFVAYFFKVIDQVKIDILRQKILSYAFGDIWIHLILIENASFLILLEH